MENTTTTGHRYHRASATASLPSEPRRRKGPHERTGVATPAPRHDERQRHFPRGVHRRLLSAVRSKSEQARERQLGQARRDWGHLRIATPVMKNAAPGGSVAHQWTASPAHVPAWTVLRSAQSVVGMSSSRGNSDRSIQLHKHLGRESRQEASLPALVLVEVKLHVTGAASRGSDVLRSRHTTRTYAGDARHGRARSAGTPNG